MKTRTSLVANAAVLLLLTALTSACAGDGAQKSEPGKAQGGTGGSTLGEEQGHPDREPSGGKGEGGFQASGGSESKGQGGAGAGIGRDDAGQNTGGGNADGTAGAAGRSGASGTGGASHSGGSFGVAGTTKAEATGGTTGGSGGSQHTGGSPATGGRENVPGKGGGSGTAASCDTPEEETFSFFLISRKALQRESGNELGFGGKLGGIEGADAICQRVAEYVSPCQKNKEWHAFLSTSKVDAIDRIGKGPWYDRTGRLLANNLTDLAQDRPSGADPAIKNDLPNEDGVPNHAPQGTQQVDNHEILTGSGLNGRLYRQDSGTGMPGMPFGGTACGNGEEWSVEKATCWDWTSSEEQGCPRVGHSWPREGSGTNWMSVWNEGGCAPGGNLDDSQAGGGLDGTRRVGSAGGYGGFYCFAVSTN